MEEITNVDALKAHLDDFTVMKRLKNEKSFFSASKDKSFKIWNIPTYWERTENLDENQYHGNDLEGTEYSYKNVELLEKFNSDEEEELPTKRKTSNVSNSSNSSSNDSGSSSSSGSSNNKLEYKVK